MSFIGSSVNIDNTVVGRGAVYVGGTTPSYSALSSSMYSVGACEGILSVNVNPSILKLNTNDSQSPYGLLETGYDVQLSLSLQEVDVFNLALATGYFTKSEDFDDITGGYNSNTSGHHGVLHSAFAHPTANTGNDSIHSIVVTDGVSLDSATISVGTNSSVLDGIDTTANSPDWVVLSGVTASGITGFNERVLKVSSGEPAAPADEITVTSTPNSGLAGFFDVAQSSVDIRAGTYTSGLGRLRRVYALDSVSFGLNGSVPIVRFNISETDDSSDFKVGDYVTLRGVSHTSAPTIGSSSVNLLEILEGNMVRIYAKDTAGFNCEFDTGQSVSSSVLYESTDFSDDITLGYVDMTTRLVFGSDSQSDYRSVMIRVEGGDDSSGKKTVSEWHFYKCKFIYNGSIDYDRNGVVTYPVTVHCLGNNVDVVGQYITPNDFERSNYYGES
tara:strand:- start:6775 stop:8103 length:1329 start_codon:yes stop_codon:yes gene_type:complete